MNIKRRSFDAVHTKIQFLEAPKKRNSYLISPSTDATKTPESNMPITTKHQNFFDGKESVITLNPVPNLKMTKLNKYWPNYDNASVSLVSKTGESPVRNDRATVESFYNGSLTPLNDSPKGRSVRRRLSDEPVTSPGLQIVMRRKERYSTQQDFGSIIPDFRRNQLFEFESNLKTVINNDDPIEFSEKQESDNKKTSAKLGLKNIRKLQQPTTYKTLQSKGSDSIISNSNERLQNSKTLSEG